MAAGILKVIVIIVAFLSTLSLSRASCPLDLDYVGIIPWNNSVCQDNQGIAVTANRTSSCCQALSSLYAIGLARRLQQTSFFRFQDLSTSVACLDEFQRKLNSLSLPSNLTSTCFDPMDYFVSNNSLCANITTLQDWTKLLGPYSSLDIECRQNTAGLESCEACVSAGLEVQSKLTSIDGNKSHSITCFYYVVLYAAGIGNVLGPGSLGTVSCMFGMSLLSGTDSGNRDNHTMKTSVIWGLVGTFSALLVISCATGLYCWWSRWKKMKRIVGDDVSASDLTSDYQGAELEWRPKARTLQFKLQDLETATDTFQPKNFIGRGQFGIVHKGKLPDGTMVAVKKIDNSDYQGEAQFRNEVDIISTLKHRNLVQLIGYSIDGNQKYLVYDYMPNGSLYEHLFGPQEGKIADSMKPLTWPQRKSIIWDIAQGLAYLHYGVRPAVYHRDIKSRNILLDADMRARLADFGLVKQFRATEAHDLPTAAAGTYGYLAPEYALYGKLSEKSDVYSFGIVLLEIMCGRKALILSSSGFEQPSLITDWAWSLVQQGNFDQVLDPSLLGDNGYVNTNSKGLMERFVLIGILCAHVRVAVRPTILDALKMLVGNIEVPEIPHRPPYA